MEEPPGQQKRGVCEGVRVRACPPAPRPGLLVGTQVRAPRLLGHPGESWKQLPPLPRVVAGQSLKALSTGSPDTSGANTLPNAPPKTTRAPSKGHLRAGCPRGSEFAEGRQQAPLPAPPARRGHWPAGSPLTRSSSWHLLGAGREEPAPPGVWAASRGRHLEPMSQRTPAYPSLEGRGPRHTKAE